jgi:hypothetical protein
MNRFVIVLGLSLIGAPAFAQGQGWSVLSGQTVGEGATVLEAQAGYPGISAGLLHGLSPKLDLGGLITFNYGVEGSLTTVTPGVKFQGLLRTTLVQGDQLNLGLWFAPGPFFYFFGSNDTRAGIAMPFGLTLGIAVSSAILLNAGIDLPFYATFGTNGGAVLPILAGIGAEYFIDRNLEVNVNGRWGPSIPFSSAKGFVSMDLLLGIAYHL